MFLYKLLVYSSCMNTISDRIRIALRQKGMTQAFLAKKISVSPQAVGKWFKTNSVSKENISKIGNTLNVSVDWLLNGEPNPFIPDNANIKRHQLIEYNATRSEVATNIQVPLINWVQAGAWSDIATNYHAEQYYPCPEKHSDHTFALTVCGESMSPDFIDGEIIYVDPQVEPKNGSCVVVQQNGNSEATFKQLVLDGSTRYLKALNPHWPEQFIKMLPDAVICGVVIGSYRKRN